LPPEDRLYLHKQVQRRLLYSVLMAVLGFMLVGSFFLENQIRSEAAAVQNADRPAPDEADRRNSAWFFAFYWVVFLLLLLVILSLAAVDLLAIARFGLRHRRQLEAEQRAILESQALPLRRERNGHQ
jgi:ABC-type Fe3+ transport system permease subunit